MPNHDITASRPKPHRYTNSMNRAQIYFVRPGIGPTRIQENSGVCDAKLRRAIEAAYKAFCEANK